MLNIPQVSLLGTDNIRGQISVYIFAPNGDYYLSSHLHFILGDPGATSLGRCDILGRKFTSRAEEPLGTYSYRTSSRSGRIPFPLIGQKNIFLPNQQLGLAGELCRLLTRSSFLQRSPTQLLGPYNGKIVVDGFRKKNIQTKPRKSQALTWGLGTNTLQ